MTVLDLPGRDQRSLYVFDGLGAGNPSLAHLRELHRRPENARFFGALLEAIESAVDHAGDDAYRAGLHDGLPLRSWLTGTGRVSRRMLEHSVVTAVCTHFHQLCMLLPRSGRSAGASGGPVAAIGHSLGLYAAVIAAVREQSPRRYLELCRRSIAFVVLVTVRAHQIARPDDVDPAVMDRYRRAGASMPEPGPMAAVTGMAAPALRDVVERHNERLGVAAVEIGLLNSPMFHVLSGRTESLVEFWLEHRRWIDEMAGRWEFLGNTAPFHSSVLRPAIRLIEGDRRFIDYDIDAGRLTVPVYGTESARNLQGSADLFRDVAEQPLTRPLDWNAAVRGAFTSRRPDVVVDFGPGASAGLFTRLCLRESGHRTPFTTVIRKPER
ncbi:ACP S-malonyltransferase [Actinoplanes utahensis]|uniref:Malonyl-CoA:ACP transacylase (MAT) domain-containing protein n=1 Tax=Actinoplanes utahensis TaxID=1869 RepID=A0A0A6UL50_ACTUT|nr:ACP S-malonyltransferase [Actinoplanes utahensis]KHD76830.1 hypothetical protein MB27_14930 [Actinoplanes utahensis]GIF33412.1 ACP S-malonyltransferase [Actinoplanes utahensis]